MNETPLFSLESEQSVIGAFLLNSERAIDRIGALRPHHFYVEANRLVFTELMAMAAENVPIDVITVAERLGDMNLNERTGGLAYLGDIAHNTPSAANVGRYAEVVINKSLERDLASASAEIRAIVASAGDTREKLQRAQAVVMGVTEAAAPKQPLHIADVLVRSVDELQKRGSGEDLRIPTGYLDLDDKLTGGMRPGNVVVIAGRPAMGKTALALNIGYRVAGSEEGVLVCSMEMSDLELTDRMIAIAGEVELQAVLHGDMCGENGDRIMNGVGKLHKMPIVIDDQGGLTLYDVATKARSVKRKHGLGLIVIDYLQLMTGEGENRTQEIGSLTRGLKALAKELQVPIIVLSQLSRKVEERTDKRPMMSDLRESGDIEQDADVIIFCYRDEYYRPDTQDKGIAEIIIGKNRQGETGRVGMTFIAAQTRFESLSSWQPRAEEAKPKRGGGFQ